MLLVCFDFVNGGGGGGGGGVGGILSHGLVVFHRIICIYTYP